MYEKRSRIFRIMIYVKAYFKKRAGTVLLITCLVLFFNFYYGMLVTSVERKYMSYFNVLLSAVCAVALLADFNGEGMNYHSGKYKSIGMRASGWGKQHGLISYL